jgi:hypothetical protein
MLRPELKESDIPHRTLIRGRISDMLEEHLEQLKSNMQVQLKIWRLRLN